MDKEKLQSTLQRARRASRNREFVQEWRQDGGIESLIEVLKQPSDSVVLGDTLSTLANCILLDDTSSKIVVEQDGVKCLAHILKSLQDPQLINRTSRTLANLCSKENIVNSIKSHRIVKTMLQRMEEVTDSHCLQSMVRAVVKFCERGDLRMDVVRSEHFKNVINCLNSGDSDVIVLALKVVQTLLPGLGEEISSRLIEVGGLEGIINACSAVPADKKEIGIACLATLVNHPAIRVSLTSVGGIELLRGEIESLHHSKSFNMSLRALCMCAKEAVNRNRIARCGALSDMVKILNSDSHARFFPEIVTALVWFLFDEASIRIMVEGGVVKGLIGYFMELTKVAEHSSKNESECLSGGYGSVSLYCKVCSKVLSSPTYSKSSVDKETTELMVVEPQDVQRMQTDVEMVTEERTQDCQRPVIQQTASPILLHPSQPWPFSPTWSISSPETSPPGARSPNWIGYQTSPPRCYSPHVLGLSRSSSLEEESFYAVSSAAGSPNPPTEGYDGGSLLEGINDACSTETISPKESVLDSIVSNLYSPPAQSSSSCGLDRYYGSADGVPAMIHGKRGPIHDVLLLLSRLSQMTDPSRVLVNAFCIDALLHYISVSSKPEPKAVRLLNRLTLNPNCFEAFFKHNLVTKIHLLLGRCYTVQELCELLDSAKRSGRMDSSDDETGVLHSSGGMGMKDSGSLGKCSSPGMKGEEVEEGNVCLNCQSMDPIRSDAWKERVPSVDSQRTCELLLSNLKAQTESSFGKGVLTHVMLTRPRQEKEVHAVALPLLCRSRTLLRKMFLELQALEILLQLLGTYDTTPEMFILACEGLSCLAYVTGAALDDTEQPETVPEDEGKTENLKTYQLKEMAEQLPAQESKSTRLLKIGEKRSGESVNRDVCKHAKLDLLESNDKACVFQISSGTRYKVIRDILTRSSPVFEAMLSTRYTDSSEDVIHIKGVKERPFLLLLHHLSGCNIDLGRCCCGEPCKFQGHTTSQKGTGSSTQDIDKEFAMPRFLKAIGNFQDTARSESGDSVLQGGCILTVIELLVCCERYMVENLKEKCEEWLKKHVNNFNVVDLYLVGCHNNAVRLRDYCMRYLFIKVKDPWLRVKAVMEIVESVEKSTFLGGLKEFLTDSVLSVK